MALKIQEWNPELGNYEVFHHYGTPDGQLMDGKDPSIGTGIQNNLNIPIGGGENVYYIPGSSAETRDNNFWTMGGATGGMDAIGQLIAQQQARGTYGATPTIATQSADPIRDIIEQRSGMYQQAPQQDAIGQLIQQREGMYPYQGQPQGGNSGGFSLGGASNWLSNLWNSIRGPREIPGIAPAGVSATNPATGGVAPMPTVNQSSIPNMDPMTAAVEKGIAARNGMKINSETGEWDPMGWGDLSFNQKLNTGLSAAQDIWGIYSGFKGLSMAQKQMDQQRRQWEKTYQANAKAQNADSWLRSMNLNNGIAPAAQRTYEQDRLNEQG